MSNWLGYRPWAPYLALLILSAGYYFVYFQGVILHPDSFLSSITGDSIKNYYTFIYHIRHDADFLNFRGMNYPFGEHVVYTDCQPLLTFILRLLPFTHNHLIGILHSLIFWSFIITPLLIFRLLRRLVDDRWSCLLFAFALSILSPLFMKIYWGHFALAYGWVIPLLFLFLMNLWEKPTAKHLSQLFVYNFLLFFIHPYTALSTCIFSFIFTVICYLPLLWNHRAGRFLFLLFCCMLPVFLFRVFMVLTDHHAGRAAEPMNFNVLEANWGCLIVPAFGPMYAILGKLLNTAPSNYEGFSYLGIFIICLSVILIPLILMNLKLIRRQKFITGILLSSIFMLFISFGWVSDILELVGIDSHDLKQFRAIARFDNYVYFGLPCFLFAGLSVILEKYSAQKNKYILAVLGLIYLLGNGFEAHYLFGMGDNSMWKSTNFFSDSQLNSEQRKNIDLLKALDPQAITTVPLFMYGSEVIDRDNWNNSMVPAMLYSSHTGISIIGSNMSRTSVTETADALDIFNEYKKDREVLKKLNNKDIAVFITRNPLLPAEQRLMNKVKILQQNDTVSIGTVNTDDLRFKHEMTFLSFDSVKGGKGDSSFIYIENENRKPFLKSSMDDYEKITVLPAGRLNTGRYAVSFHYHFSEFTARGLACNLIMTRKKGNAYEWFFNDGIKRLTAVYPGFVVYEVFLNVEPETEYEFLLKGTQKESYNISHFMIRPEHQEIGFISGKDSLINNFPVSAY